MALEAVCRDSAPSSQFLIISALLIWAVLQMEVYLRVLRQRRLRLIVAFFVTLYPVPSRCTQLT